MAEAERTMVVEEKPEKVWAALSDIKNWNYLFKTQTTFKTISPVYQILPPGVAGPGMRYSVSTRRKMIQIWHAAEWTPPKKLRTVQEWSASRVFATKSSFDVQVTPLNLLSTQITFKISMDYSHPLWGAVFNLCFGPLMKSGAKNLLANLDKKTAHLISAETTPQ